MMTRTIALLLALLLPPVAGADVYQWQDANGNTIFSDQPPQHLQSSIRKQTPKPLSRRSQRDQLNVRLLPDRERRLLAAMEEYRRQLQQERQAHRKCDPNNNSSDLPSTDHC